ncbi:MULTISPECIES: Flp family type IVb pilin [Arthrobacter]|uniref:Flp family type IVb pilin n=2 Tax=Arthrobacter TaxID=1663 RepID=A0ABU9KIK6_9MICC|nr:Flp family type IVb pilin [Arthrobacter sp. YJM1]MDP5225764.1 Flp family type IVb pilin [Arthrobacter sp. YJM1]
MDKILVTLMSFWNDITNPAEKEKGATGTEYALLVAFIALIIIVGVTAFGTALSSWFSSLGTTVSGWAK